ncbi:hypothetical protein D3C81_1522240 [compost metagenome]
MQRAFRQPPPAVDAAKHWPIGDARRGDPVEISLHWAQARQRRSRVGHAEAVAIRLAARQEDAHALPGLRLDVFHLQAT